MEREKKQFRLFDIYRKFFTQTDSRIRGIQTYGIRRYSNEYFDEYDIKVIYSDGIETNFTTNNEDGLKQIVRQVNKHLKNCSKPGRKRKVNY